MKIVRWIDRGELAGKLETTEDVVMRLARLLDKSCIDEGLGDVYFQAEDGKYYRAVFEGRLTRVSKRDIDEHLREME